MLPLLGHAGVNAAGWYRLGDADADALLATHSANLWIPSLFLLALGAFLLHRTNRAAPRPSLTMGVA